jgi:hypothetical protein
MKINRIKLIDHAEKLYEKEKQSGLFSILDFDVNYFYLF